MERKTVKTTIKNEKGVTFNITWHNFPILNEGELKNFKKISPKFYQLTSAF